MKDKILLFIPAYNCEKQITRVLSQIDNTVAPFLSEVILINNLSTDDTVNAAKEYLKTRSLNCKIINNDENYNLGGSHKVAFNYAMKHNFDYVVVLHGDDQADIHDFLPVFKRKIYRKYDCILGSRFMKGSKLSGYSKKRIIGNHIFNIIFSTVLRRKITDLGSGLNMYKVQTLQSKYYHKYPDALYFNDFMIMASCYYNHHFRFYPISWNEKDQVSNNKLLSFSISLFKLLFRYTINKRKLMTSDLRNKAINEYTYKIIYSTEENK